MEALYSTGLKIFKRSCSNKSVLNQRSERALTRMEYLSVSGLSRHKAKGSIYLSTRAAIKFMSIKPSLCYHRDAGKSQRKCIKWSSVYS